MPRYTILGRKMLYFAPFLLVYAVLEYYGL
jgi:hypothetical protein